jgi:hypothetical protein
VDESPIDRLIAAIDNLDIDAVMAMVAPDCRMLTVDGHRAEGAAGVRQVLSTFFASLRSTSHVITAQWHQDDVWIAELEANYELRDWLQVRALPRAFVVRAGPQGFVDVHVYGAHERPLTEHRTGEEGMVIGERWIPPL